MFSVSATREIPNCIFAHDHFRDMGVDTSFLLSDSEDLIVQLGKFLEIRTDDLRLYHQIVAHAKHGKALLQSRSRRRAPEFFGEKFHSTVGGQCPIDKQGSCMRAG